MTPEQCETPESPSNAPLGESTRIAALLTLTGRDPHRRGIRTHGEEVAAYAVGLAQALGFGPSEAERIHLAALLHDVGKTMVSEATLTKPGPLNEHEWTEMARHPALGAKLIDHPDLADVRLWTLAHHERPDGSGYPFGLTGDAIPLGARIIAVADAYAAMTSNRPYRAALSRQGALVELVRGAGTQFDELLVTTFVQRVGMDGRFRSSPQLSKFGRARGQVGTRPD